MAGPWFIDDSGVPPGDATDGTTWEKAYTSLKALTDAKTLAAGEIIYIGADSVDQNSYSAAYTATFPAGGTCKMISSTVNTGTTVSYSKSSTRQIDTSNNGAAAHKLVIDGGCEFYGVSMKAGGSADSITLNNSNTEGSYYKDCTFAPGDNGYVYALCGNQRAVFDDCTVSCAADTTSRANGIVRPGGSTCSDWNNLVLSSVSNRTGVVLVNENTLTTHFSGCDFSQIGAGVEIANLANMLFTVVENCLMPATWSPYTENVTGNREVFIAANCGSADDPTHLIFAKDSGAVASVAVSSGEGVIYRTGGATVEGYRTAWLVTTGANCSTSQPFETPWLYGTIDSTGSKTLTVCIVSDSGGGGASNKFLDSEVWLQVQYLKDADETTWATITDRVTPTGTAADQGSDSSTWNGTGPSFTNKQALAVTVTIGETGKYRARVCVAKASIASSSYFYVDPKVTVT